MSVASDTMYNTRTAASYVSSSAYYGYVPHCSRSNHLEHNPADSPPTYDRCSYETSMETDDYEGHEYTVASRRLSNDCVIPDARNNRLERQQQAVHHADTLLRRNRKRCSGELGPTREMKKFREGSGDSCVYRGTGCTKGHGFATVRYDSPSLYLKPNNDQSLEQSVNEHCWQAAGNHSFLSCKRLLMKDSLKLNESNGEYEKMLFGTHGCSVYHHYRLQLLDKNCIETEF